MALQRRPGVAVIRAVVLPREIDDIRGFEPRQRRRNGKVVPQDFQHVRLRARDLPNYPRCVQRSSVIHGEKFGDNANREPAAAAAVLSPT